MAGMEFLFSAAGARGTIFCLKSHDPCLKSYDHEMWHAGPLGDLKLHEPRGILIFRRVAPQAHPARFFV